MGNEWPSEPQLRDRLALLLGPPPCAPAVAEWQGTAFRFASRAYADLTRFTDGEGARKHGGRFTPKGGPRTLYLAQDARTATTELMSWYDYY